MVYLLGMHWVIIKPYTKKFLSMEENCSYQTLLRAVPHYIRKESASNSGTYLCATCLNPKLKLESLANKNMLKKIDLDEMVNSETEFDEFLASIKQISMKYKEETVIYNAWTKLPTPLSPKWCKISRKMPRDAKVPDLRKILIDELKILKDHLHRAQMQFKAFKLKMEPQILSPH